MGSKKTFALLLDYLGGDYQSGLLAGVSAVAEERDVNLLAVIGRSLRAPRATDASQNDIYSRLGAERVDGMIVSAGNIGIYAGADALKALVQRFAPLPVVSVGAHIPGVPSLVVSNRSGQKTIVDHLIDEHACRRIAYVRGPLESEEAEERFRGYADALLAHDLELDRELVGVGNFWINSGAEATLQLLGRQCEFDALVAANDYMALGALQALREYGKRIPHDVLVAGFDDVPSSREGYRSLTTVRQPIELLGRSAAEMVLRMIDGERVLERSEHQVELITRQSCGCAYRIRQKPVPSLVPELGRSVLDVIRECPSDLRELLEAAAALPRTASGGWVNRLLSALAEELEGQKGRFLLGLEDVLDEVQAQGKPVEEFNAVVGALRSHFRRMTSSGPTNVVLDDLWHAALLQVVAASNRGQVRLRTASERAHDELRMGVERLSTAFDHEALKTALEEVLGTVGIEGACLSLYEDHGRSLRCLFSRRAGRERALGAQAFPDRELAPARFWPERRWSYVLMPVTFDTQQLGVVLLEFGAATMVYPMLREQIGAALKGAALHRAIVAETTRRERAEHERLNGEAEVARQIQTAILPVDERVVGLEWAGTMVPAYEVGGDYYDVLPTETGCWIGMGDVAGHGLMSGLVMLMMQSMVAATVSQRRSALPSEVVIAVNTILRANVRTRLRRDDHASLVLLRYESGGKVTFAGFHEEILIWRRKTAAWERIETSGVWVGAVDDIAHALKDADFTLDEGDLLVLYSDGAVEAMNARSEQFGVDRLCRAVDSCVAESPQAICGAVVERVRAWAPSQADDITLLVARQRKV